MTHTAAATIEITAYHEAGHAVAAVLLERPFSKVDIVGDQVAAGRIIYEDRPDPPDQSTKAQWAEHDLIVTLAGAVAQRRFSPDSDWRHGMGQGEKLTAPRSDLPRLDRPSDFQTVILGIADLGYTREAAVAYRAELQARAEALIEDLWPAVKQVAEALLEHKTLWVDDIQEIIFPGSMS